MQKYPPQASERLTSFENLRERIAGPDLVRSVAILDVLICHDGSLFLDWWHRTLPFHLAVLGFYGVMLFFVLSGFLIGTIMLDLLERGTSLKGWGIFLIRRWMRTLPAYYVWLFFLLIPLAYFGPYGVVWDEARRVLPWFLTLTQNLGWPMVSNWYGVTWSLCVEEWFYITFPALLLTLLACRVKPALAFGSTLAAFFIVPLCWRLALPADVNWDEVTSKIVPCRFDSIAWGITAACLTRYAKTVSRLHIPLALIGTGIVLTTWLADLLPIPLWTHHFQTMAIFDVVGFGYALCMPAMMRLRTLPPLIGPAVRSLSTHSYGLYLCHLPLVMMAGDLQARYGLGRRHAVIFTLLTTIGGAIISWRFVERPCLKIRPVQSLT
ncbi:acyltransferase family protein [Gluconobacter albidus]|uniref:acyltransferase family protein n=1 Tax=Gluconobacter albidus TaxID=318683 RepID=UPI001B8D47B3|nr:acyltransferase [Gluconobacter albidus]MBS1027385.1 acyltransferase [Gluconobacter albidus]